LRILGALLAGGWTLFGILVADRLLGVANPLLTGVLLPLFAGTLLVIVLSYVFTATLIATGSTPGSGVGAGLAVLYLVLCTGVLVVSVALAVAFIVDSLWNAAMSLIGLVALTVFLVPHAVQVLVAYVVAATFAPFAPFRPAVPTGGVDRPAECLVRGMLIGMNATMNGVFALALYTPLFGGGAGLVMTLAVTAVIVLATACTSLLSATVPPAMPAAATVQGVTEAFTGWHSWLMPMSWPYCAIGWWRFYVSWFRHVCSLAWPGTFPAATNAIQVLQLDVDSGAMTITGGSQARIPAENGYNSGCFSFAGAGTTAASVWQHEAGHHLHLAAFGSFVHVIDTLNEQGYGGITGQGSMAYGERVAESNVRGTAGTWEVPVWR
jgi:hypothetical protein